LFRIIPERNTKIENIFGRARPSAIPITAHQIISNKLVFVFETLLAPLVNLWRLFAMMYTDYPWTIDPQPISKRILRKGGRLSTRIGMTTIIRFKSLNRNNLNQNNHID
jgi:hypothetical protein